MRRVVYCEKARNATWSPSAAIRKPGLPDRNRELAREVHALGPRPLYELLRELDRGAPLLETLRHYSELLPLAGFIERMGGRDL
jgi:hypothetical protein